MLCHFTSLILLASSCLASPLSPKDANAGAASVDASAKGKPTSEESTTFDGVPLANIQAAPAPEEEVVTMAAIGQAGWTIVASSQQGSNPATSAIDGSTTTFWHSEYSPTLRALPHTVTVDMKAVALVGSISCLPRQDGSSNGRIGQHTIQLR